MSKLTRNIQAISTAMKEAGIKAAEVWYSGSGDSGDGCDHSIEWARTSQNAELPDKSPKAASPEVDIVLASYRYENGEHVTEESSQKMHLQSAMEEVLWDALKEIGRSGFENDEGGYGTLRVDQDGLATLTHTDRFIEGSETTSEYDRGDAFEIGFGDLQEAIVAALNAAGHERVLIRYSGYGDSGEVNEVEFDGDPSSMPRIKFMGRAYEQDESGQWQVVPRELEESFEDALQTLLWRVVDASGHANFENNEGGDGCMTVQASGRVLLEHSDNIERGDSDEYSWSVFEPEQQPEEVTA